MPHVLRAICLCGAVLAAASPALADDYRLIAVIDHETGDPVPGATLRTKHNVTYTSDKNGLIAFYEPGLMGQFLYFHFERPGYTLLNPSWGGGLRVEIPSDPAQWTVVQVEQTGDAPMLTRDERETTHLIEGLPDAGDYFEVRFVDAETDRGVPLVQLSVDDQVYVSDNAGRIAFYESKYMGDAVTVDLWTHGYEVPATLRLEPTTGGERVVALSRVNIAERTARLTGAGLYDDSVRLGYDTPLENPLDNGRLAGQDTVMVTPYDGRLFWVWGDTLSLDNALGNFRAAGATSQLPEPGEGIPGEAIDLEYFETETGFTAQMAPDETVPGSGATWLSKLFTLEDDSGRETLYAYYGMYRSNFEKTEHGMVAFDDASQRFEEVVDWGLEHDDSPFLGRVNRLEAGGSDHLYIGYDQRIAPTRAAIADPTQREVYTPLNAAGTTVEERDERGRPVYRWKAAGTAPNQAHVLQGILAEDALLNGTLIDSESGKPLLGNNHILAYNAHRDRWVSLVQEAWGVGPSFAGEIWYAEADTPMGPWTYARKVVTHDAYTFYNIQMHPWYDEDNGRVIHFEGTYTKWLTSTAPTPRYDYNQILYTLDLSDPRLSLPVPVYDVLASTKSAPQVTRAGLHADATGSEILFWAPESPSEWATVPVAWEPRGCQHHTLVIGGDSSLAPSFYLIDPDRVASDEPPPNTVPVYAMRDEDTEQERLTLDETSQLVGYAWKNHRNLAFPTADYLGPLHADAGPDQCVEADGTSGEATVQLTASDSIGDDLAYTWTWAGGTATHAIPTIALPVGEHLLELEIVDAEGRRQSDTLYIAVAPSDDIAPPEDDDTPGEDDDAPGEDTPDESTSCQLGGPTGGLALWGGLLASLARVRRRRSAADAGPAPTSG